MSSVRIRPGTVTEDHDVPVPDEAERLRDEVARLHGEGRLDEATTVARALLNLRHEGPPGEVVPRGFAGVLDALAGRLHERGDLAGARWLLERALAAHPPDPTDSDPDRASLTRGLAGVLRGEGDLAGAETLLRRAFAAHERAWGERHPESIRSLEALTALLLARGDLAGAKPYIARSLALGRQDLGEESLPSDSTPDRDVSPLAEASAAEPPSEPTALDDQPEPSPGTVPSDSAWPSAELWREHAALTECHARLAEAFSRAAEGLRSPGALPPDGLLEQWDECRRRFDDLRGRVSDLAESLGQPPAGPEPASLDDLAALLRLLTDVESRLGDLQRRALAVLDRVAGLRHADRDDFEPLAQCLSRSDELRRTLDSCSPAELTSQAGPLVDGAHPLAALLTLVGDHSSLDDDDWATAHEAVATTFGRALAAAVARGKIVATTADRAP